VLPPGRIAGAASDEPRGGRQRGRQVQAVITRAEAEALGIPLREATAAEEAAVLVPPSRPEGPYRGVVKSDAFGVDLWEAVFTLPSGQEVSGGEYESPREAAHAYDALARMYGRTCGPVETNFEFDPYTAWVPPDEVLTTGQTATLPGVPLTVEEVLEACRVERGIDVRAVPLAGRSDIADALVFVTGRSVPHMRKIADTVARALRKRALPNITEPGVENREGDDWMVVDCGNLIVNVMDAETREVFALEAFYESMKIGTDPYAGMTYDTWLEANPVPEKWLRRLERDEAELAARGGRVAGLPPQEGRGASSSGPGRGGAYSFPASHRAKIKTKPEMKTAARRS